MKCWHNIISTHIRVDSKGEINVPWQVREKLLTISSMLTDKSFPPSPSTLDYALHLAKELMKENVYSQFITSIKCSRPYSIYDSTELTNPNHNVITPSSKAIRTLSNNKNTAQSKSPTYSVHSKDNGRLSKRVSLPSRQRKIRAFEETSSNDDDIDDVDDIDVDDVDVGDEEGGEETEHGQQTLLSNQWRRVSGKFKWLT